MPRNQTKHTTAVLSAPHPPAIRFIIAGRHIPWTPILTHHFPHKPTSFIDALYRMFLHPEHSSSWILRSDILSDSNSQSPPSSAEDDVLPKDVSVPGFTVTRTLVRRFMPRNPQRDKAACQTGVFLSSTDLETGIRELVVLLAHEGQEGGDEEGKGMPYYLPAVTGTAFLLSPEQGEGGAYTITLLYALFSETEPTLRLERTALHLLVQAAKLAKGVEEGYEQRVHHDVVIAREEFQDRYVAMRARHASRLVGGWREKTDPSKHVFEDILIAAFLCCLWEGMYPGPEKMGWVGFVDIGCGNGVLVDILLREGWCGSGFDARARKSWAGFEEVTREKLAEKVLVPWLLPGAEEAEEDWVYDGRFDKGTFIISNHADELTPWTPLLAAASRCPFLAIPCCSHDLGGAKKRFPPPKALVAGDTGDLRNQNYSKSTYASLCAYVEHLARDVGWDVEREVLRIPSTRNMGIIGRRRVSADEEGEGNVGRNIEGIRALVMREGGGVGWKENVEALRKAEVKGH